MTADTKALVERLGSHMGRADPDDLLRDCHEAAAVLTAQSAELARVKGERDEARALSGFGCDAANGGAHTVVKHAEGYLFCGGCGYTIKNPTLTERARKLEARALTAEALLDKAVEALDGLYEWWDRDGSVGGAGVAFEDHRATLSEINEARR